MSYTSYQYFNGFDQTSFNASSISARETSTVFNQQLRVNSDFDGPFNFVVGGFYESTLLKADNDSKASNTNYNAAANEYVVFSAVSRQRGRSFSVFTQGRLDLTDKLELSAGVRYTDLEKHFRKYNIYGFAAFNSLTTVYPGSSVPGLIVGDFSGSNVSPEATLTYRPTSNQTLFVAYKTGFKAGGFSIGNSLQTTSKIGDFDFDSEKAKGFEAGFKGIFANGRVRLNLAAFACTFSGLQVNSYNLLTLTFVVGNAGALRQRRFEADGSWQLIPEFTLHAAVAYVHNRYHNYISQCFGTHSRRGRFGPPPWRRRPAASSTRPR